MLICYSVAFCLLLCTSYNYFTLYIVMLANRKCNVRFDIDYAIYIQTNVAADHTILLIVDGV